MNDQAWTCQKNKFFQLIYNARWEYVVSFHNLIKISFALEFSFLLVYIKNVFINFTVYPRWLIILNISSIHFLHNIYILNILLFVNMYLVTDFYCNNIKQIKCLLNKEKYTFMNIFVCHMVEFVFFMCTHGKITRNMFLLYLYQSGLYYLPNIEAEKNVWQVYLPLA